MYIISQCCCKNRDPSLHYVLCGEAWLSKELNIGNRVICKCRKSAELHCWYQEDENLIQVGIMKYEISSNIMIEILGHDSRTDFSRVMGSIAGNNHH